MTGVRLRAARSTDAPAITGVFLAARQAMTYLPVIHTDDEAVRFIAGLVERTRVQVAEVGQAVIGFAAVAPGWLEHLNVHPRAQGRGVGSRLIGWAKEVSPAGLDLWVFERNTGARALYVAHGWREVGRTDGDNEEGQPDVRMRWGPEPVDGRS